MCLSGILFSDISSCPLPNRPLQQPPVLHAQVALPCCADHRACRESGGGASASTMHPIFVGVCINKAYLKRVAAVCSTRVPDLLYAGIRALHRVSTRTVIPGAPRSGAMEAETMPVCTSGTWPLLAARLVDCKGQKPLFYTAWAKPETAQGHGVTATTVGVEFWMHKDIPVHLINVILRWQYRVLVALAAKPDALAFATVLGIEVSLKDPVLHATAGVRTRMVEVLRGL